MGLERSATPLARLGAFTFADLQVNPPALRFACAGRVVRVEPRVMEVFVILAHSAPDVVSRDQLIEGGWKGRIVSDSAVNRVFSRLRQALAEVGSAVSIETLPKIGYRLEGSERGLSPEAPAGPAAADRSLLTRRAALLAGGAALAAGGSWFTLGREPHLPSLEAAALFRRAELLRLEDSPRQTEEAARLYEQAVAIDPDFAAAWAALALARVAPMDWDEGPEMHVHAMRTEQAARRALALDPGNADAALALAEIPSSFRAWGQAERVRLSLVDQHPQHWASRLSLAGLFLEVGRHASAAANGQVLVSIDGSHPAGWLALGLARWGSGDLRAAERSFAQAVERSSLHALAWVFWFNFLFFTGQTREARELLDRRLPINLAATAIPDRIRLIDAFEQRTPAAIAAALADCARLDAVQPVNAIMTAPRYVALERLDLALTAINRFFFGDLTARPPVAPPTVYSRRSPYFLFLPFMQPLWERPEMREIARRIGLFDYWRAAGEAPALVRRSA